MIDPSRAINRISHAIAMVFLVGCNAPPEAPAPLAPADSAQLPAAAMTDPVPSENGVPQSKDMRLLGVHDLQGRSAYQPLVHAYGDRRILFVGHHIGEAMNPLTGSIEQNGTSILDVTDPSAPEMLAHVPPSIPDISGVQHVQICNGSTLPNGDPEKIYALRTPGLIGWDLYDVTDPASPRFIREIAATGFSSRPESARGDQETHKMQWDCETGIGYLNGTPEGWRVTRLLMTYDLSNPEEPQHIRDFGLVGWEPDSEEPFPPPEIAGLHQPVVVGNRMYLGYEAGGSGVLQILDRDKFLNGAPGVEDPLAPTPQNFVYPQISRLDMPSYWGVHTAKPIYDMPIPDYVDDRDLSTRDLLIIVSETSGGSTMRCQTVRDVMFIVDITEEEKPFPISTFQVAEEPGDYCHKGGRFGPHSMHDEFHPGFDKTLVLLSYFNAGIRAVDIRNPFDPVEAAYYVPEPNENGIELCVEVQGVEHCDKVISTNNVNIDDRGYIYAVDRAHNGLHIVELTGAAREIVGLD